VCKLVLALLDQSRLVGHQHTSTTHAEDGIGHKVILYLAWVEAVCGDLCWHEQSNAVGVSLHSNSSRTG
jgi:hypothetical protein